MWAKVPEDMKMQYVPRKSCSFSWPELQGKDVEEARKIIQAECPDVRIQVLGAVGAFVAYSS